MLLRVTLSADPKTMDSGWIVLAKKEYFFFFPLTDLQEWGIDADGDISELSVQYQKQPDKGGAIKGAIDGQHIDSERWLNHDWLTLLAFRKGFRFPY